MGVDNKQVEIFSTMYELRMHGQCPSYATFPSLVLNFLKNSSAKCDALLLMFS